MEADLIEALVRRHEHSLYRTALAILANPQEAEDAVQDTFVKYLEKRPSCPDEARERAWLLRVTVNGCKTRLRSPWRHTVPLEEWLPAPAPEETEALEAVLALPPKERIAVHLFYYEGYRTAEIAALTGAAEGTVRSWLSRARVHLKKLLEGESE